MYRGQRSFPTKHFLRVCLKSAFNLTDFRPGDQYTITMCLVLKQCIAYNTARMRVQYATDMLQHKSLGMNYCRNALAAVPTIYH